MNVGTERIRGWQDIPLDPNGMDKVRGLGKDVAEHQPVTIFSSDLTRAVQTTEAILFEMGTNVPTVKRMELRPWNVGKLTGMPVKDIKDELLRLLKAKTEPAPGGEAYDDFAQRFVTFFVDITTYARKLGKPVAVVTHSRNVRVVRALVDGGIHKVMTEAPDKVLLRDEDPVEPAGHGVLIWNGGRWNWTDDTDTIHTPDSAAKAGRSIHRRLASP